MTINPFISTQSYNFQFGVDQGLFVKERNSSTVPALTWFRDVTSAGLLGMVSNKMPITTIFGHKHFGIKNFGFKILSLILIHNQ